MTGGARRALGVIAVLAFASLGLPDGVLGVAWPSMRRSFDLPVSALGGLLAAGTLGYLASSAASGALAARLGLGWLLALSSLAGAASAVAIGLAPAWGVVLLGGLLGGLGGGAIDAAINAFAAARFPPGVTSWLHASYGVGATLGPILASAALAAGGSWRLAYAAIALALLGLAATFARTAARWTVARPSGAAAGPRSPMAAALARLAVWRQVALFFGYAGLEVGAGQWAYTWLVDGRGVAPAIAGGWVAAFWGSLTAGRVVAGGLARRVRAATLLAAALAAAPVGVVVLWSATGPAAGAAGLVLLGLALAPVFPLLIAETPARVGPAIAAHAIGLQVAAFYLGAAVLPGLAGLLAGRLGLDALGPFLLGTALGLLGLNARAGRGDGRAPAAVASGGRARSARP
jgi:fucose permease